MGEYFDLYLKEPFGLEGIYLRMDDFRDLQKCFPHTDIDMDLMTGTATNKSEDDRLTFVDSEEAKVFIPKWLELEKVKLEGMDKKYKFPDSQFQGVPITEF